MISPENPILALRKSLDLGMATLASLQTGPVLRSGWLCRLQLAKIRRLLDIIGLTCGASVGCELGIVNTM